MEGFKKRVIVLCIVIGFLLLLFFSGFIVHLFTGGGQGNLVMLEDGDLPGQGVPVITANGSAIQASYLYSGSSILKIYLQRDGKKEHFNFTGDGSTQTYPPALGMGTYDVSILENVEGKQYRVLYTQSVTVTEGGGGGVPAGAPDAQTASADAQDKAAAPKSSSSSDSAYLLSIKDIDWSDSMDCIKKAKSLTESLKTDTEKAKAIYSYIVKNISYDYDKYNNVSTSYVPDLEAIYSARKGICYDYSALFAAMCRSVGIPTKLCKGYCTKITTYHAWNQVKLDGSWVTVDTTVDATYYAAGKTYSFNKSGKDYTVSKSY